MSKYFSKCCFSVVLCMMFLVSACGDDNKGGNNTTTTTTPPGGNNPDGSSGKNFLAGKFAGNKAGSFYANKKASASASVRPSLLQSQAPLAQQVSSASTETELAGKLEDGDITFNLKGFYNEKDNVFSLSAGSSTLIYQITGTLKDGKMSNTEATVKIKTDGEWKTYKLEVTPTDEVAIDGSASGTQVDGLPESWFGVWIWEIEEGYGYYLVITSHQLFLLDYPEYPAGILDVKKLGDKKFETIWNYYDCEDEDEDCDERVEFFIKVWLEEVNGGLQLTEFLDSESTDYSITAAFNTAGVSSNLGETFLTRP